jgi:hypothetical protein
VVSYALPVAVRLVIQVVGIAPDGVEMVAAHAEANDLALDHLEVLIRDCLRQATLAPQKLNQLEVAISLSSTDDPSVRPALHLSRDTIDALARAQASLDFDPYV